MSDGIPNPFEGLEAQGYKYDTVPPGSVLDRLVSRRPILTP